MAEKKAITVATDSGKFQTKSITGDGTGKYQRISFLTKMVETDEDVPSTPNTYIIEIDKKKYKLGSLEGFHDYQTTKGKDLHKYCTYASIAAHGIKSGSDIVLAIGCPLSEHKTKAKREAYMRFMLGIDDDVKLDLNKPEVEISFRLNGKPYRYNIVQFYVFPETSGFLAKYQEHFAHDRVGIVDIGGLNVNGAVYEKLIPNTEKAFTIEKGGNIFKQSLRQKLNSEFPISLQEDDMDSILEMGYIRRIAGVENAKEKTREFIKREKQNFINSIRDEMRSLRWSVDTYRFIFVGGGTALFEEEIREVPEFKEDLIISSDPIWDNVEGFAISAGLPLEIDELEIDED